MDAPRTVGLTSCVICRKLILETWRVTFDQDHVMTIHEVPSWAAFRKHKHGNPEKGS